MNDTDLPFPDDVGTDAITAPQTVYPSVLPHLPAAEYHSHRAVSKHGLDDFRKAPSLYRYRRDNPKPPTPALLFGSLYHTVILEPETIDQLYSVVPPDAPKRPTKAQLNAKKPSLETLEAIAFWDAFNARTAGKTVVEAEDIELCLTMRKAMLLNPAARNALLECRLHTEASLFWQDARTGVKCRARPDIIRTDGLIIDPKTCADASPDAFMRAAYDYGYFRQAAMYMDAWKTVSGEEPKAFVFIAQESEPPFLNAVYVASPQMIELGRAQLAEDLARFAECERTDTWPGLSDRPTELNLPPWALPKAA